jgi:hypothetical protein
MKALTLAAVLLLAMHSINAKSNPTTMSVKDGGSGSHGYTTNINGGEGVRPFKASFDGEGVRGGLLDGGVGSRGGFRVGGASSGGGYQLNSEHGVER